LKYLDGLSSLLIIMIYCYKNLETTNIYFLKNLERLMISGQGKQYTANIYYTVIHKITKIQLQVRFFRGAV
jgi:hypothetical protein